MLGLQQQLEFHPKGLDGLTNFVKNVGAVSGAIDAGIAVYQAYKNPTVGSVSKAILKSGLFALEVVGKANPVVGIITGVLDLTGVTDYLLIFKL